MTPAETVASLLVMVPAVWAAVHLAMSRLAEMRAERGERAGMDEADVAMLRHRARTLMDSSRLMPNWMLAVLLAALAWRGAQLLLTLAG